MESNQNDFTLFIKCPYCNGRKTEEKRTKIDSRTTSVEIIPCQHCSGYGQQVKKQHYLSHDIYTGKRDSDFYWDILKHKLPIPNYMYYGTKETCKACQGNGYIESKTEAERKTIITKNKCAECHGTGRKTIRTKKDLFGEVFKEYTLAKNKQRDSWNAIKNKAWESSEYAGYQEAHPWGYWEVCIRCDKHYASIEELNVCMGCTNESMCPENGCYFTPVDDVAKNWYINGGYKKNIGYCEEYDHWKKMIPRIWR